MCNVDCLQWAAKVLQRQDVEDKRVIEVGSYNVNGSLRNIIKLLNPREYVGVDMVEGPGVDEICKAEDLVNKYGKEQFDLVISTCVLEHIRDWKSSVSNMKNVCRPGGIILIIVPARWPFHEYPYDYWRYTVEDIKNIFSDCDFLKVDEDKQDKSLVYAKIKKPDNFIENDLSSYVLYSIITKKKVKEISDQDLKTLHFRFLVLKNKFLDLSLKIARRIFN